MLSRVLVAALMFVAMSAHAGDGFDMPGSDYANFNASSPFICRDSCGGDTRCQAWVWVKPGVQGPNAQCWLKDKARTRTVAWPGPTRGPASKVRAGTAG